MSVKIVHAYSDENKKAKGGAPGDQTGREIFVQDWYERDGGWGVCLECTDRDMAEAAAATAIDIAEDDSFGYDQDQRWTGADAIAAAGGDVFSAGESEFDCSSLVDTAYMLNGLEIERGYTGNLESRYLATGKFIAHREAKYLESGKYAPVGSLYLMAGKHVAIVVESDASPSVTEADNVEEVIPEVETPYVLVIGSVNVRTAPGKESPCLTTAHNGDCLTYLGTDEMTGWHKVTTPRGDGWITGKSKYTELVL